MTALRGSLGAAAGAVVGYFLVGWILRQGFYAMAIPGATLGLGYGWAAGRRSPVAAGICAAVAIPFGLFVEWSHRPFVADRSLGFFVQNLGKLQPITWLMIGAGAFAAYWFALGVGRRG